MGEGGGGQVRRGWSRMTKTTNDTVISHGGVVYIKRRGGEWYLDGQRWVVS
jgi:hypothetical protein